MNKPHNVVNELLEVQFATITNLYSPTAKSVEGSLLKVSRDIRKYLKAGFVQQIPFDLKPRNKRQQFFYYVTREGAKAVDREEDFKQKITKSINNAEHESMKIDVALSFLRNFPDYEFEFNYNAILDGLKPDIFIRAKNIQDQREFTFLVEIERKKEFTRTNRDKITKYNKKLKEGLFKKYRLPYNTKILFVCANLRYDVYLRPQQYDNPSYKQTFELLYKQFNDFLYKITTNVDNRFLFLPFPEFNNIHEPVWRIANGTKTKIMFQ